MKRLRNILVGVVVAVAAFGALHVWLNLGGMAGIGLAGDADARKDMLRVGFLPVT
jgi:hypothetical protein